MGGLEMTVRLQGSNMVSQIGKLKDLSDFGAFVEVDALLFKARENVQLRLTTRARADDVRLPTRIVRAVSGTTSKGYGLEFTQAMGSMIEALYEELDAARIGAPPVSVPDPGDGSNRVRVEGRAQNSDVAQVVLLMRPEGSGLLLEELLRKQGIRASLSPTVEATLATLGRAQKQLCVLFVDTSLAGKELANLIVRAKYHGEDPKIFIVSERVPSAEERMALLKAGASQLLLHPFPIPPVLNQIRRIIKVPGS
jgi:hypothetical protein